MAGHQPGSTLFNHQYRVRPTTVDQKRKLTRSNKLNEKSLKSAIITQRKSVYDDTDTSTKSILLKSKSKKSEKQLKIDDNAENENDDFFEPKNNEANDFNIATTDSNLIESADLFREPEEKPSKPRIHEKEKKYYAESGDFESGEIKDDSNWDTDIEIDNEKDKANDFSCEGIYLESCRKQKIIPASYFLRHLKDTEITLKHHGLGAPGIRPVSAALMNNNIVTKLDLSDNWLGPQGAEYISRMLKENCFISDLNLSENHLSTKGCEILREILKTNTSLTHLTFQGNAFDDNSAAVWADIISNTMRIEYLDLSHNNFGDEAGKLIGGALAENASVHTIDLSWNNIRRKGSMGIAKGLASNSGIKKFNISWNGLSQDGAKAFFKVIKENEVLEELDLTNNRIATEGAVYISKGLATNQTLKVIKMGLNPMESAGCFSIIKSLQKNLSTKLEFIDFSEIIVDKFFQEEYRLFQANFPHIKVKTGCDGVNLKPKKKTHPIVKLKNWFEKHQMKLIDFFAKFDKDGSMTVSRDEFKSGLLGLGVNLSQEEMTELIEELDPDNDGEINYSELRSGMSKYK